MSSDAARLQSKFSRRLEEQLRLQRFFSKLLQEVVQLNATSIVFQVEADAMHVRLLVVGIEQKRIKVRSEWYPLVVGWLEQRWAPTEDLCSSEQTAVSNAPRFPLQIRLDDIVVRASAVRGQDTLSLESIEQLPVHSLLDQLSTVSERQVEEVRSILRNDTGIVIVVVPQARQVSRGVSTMLGLSGGLYGGDFEESTVQKLAFHLAAKELILVSIVADGIETALESIGQQFTPSQLDVIKGVVGLTFLPSNCSSCSAAADIPKQLARLLPPDLPTVVARYRNGAGCANCRNTGFRGWKIALQALQVDVDERELLEERPGKTQIGDFLSGYGWVSFEDQAKRLAYNGSITFEAMSASLESFRSASIDHESIIEVDDNYFTTDSDAVQPKALSGAQAFTADARQKLVDPEDDSLFTPPKSGMTKAELEILVVEDDESQREILQVVLGQEGYSVSSVENGLEALGDLKRGVPHLVITDIMMPKMNGIELVTAMKSDEQLKDIPIMVLTVLNDSDREYMLLDMGVDDYCEKTIQRKILIKRVENLLRRFYKLS